jgi:hypothetical protein
MVGRIRAGQIGAIMTFDQIVEDYINCVRPHASAHVDEFRNQRSLRDAIRHAALCHWLPSLKRHPHQYRIPDPFLQEAERKLQHVAKALARARPSRRFMMSSSIRSARCPELES